MWTVWIARNSSIFSIRSIPRLPTIILKTSSPHGVHRWHKRDCLRVKFYVYFNDEIAVPVEDKDVWSTYKRKRDQDHKLIMGHLEELNTVRTYRIVGNLKLLANDIEGDAIPRLKAALGKWRNSVRITDLVLLVIAIGLGGSDCLV